LIQAAGAFVHLQKNFQHPSHSKHSRRLPPAARLFELALRNLEGLPNEFRALDLVRFRELLRRYRDEIVAADFRRNPWSPDTAPKL
jgi:Uma2 family endonuclease